MTVFGEVYADAYDLLYGDKDYAGECDMIESLLSEFGGARPVRRLLDLGCGTGSHSILLAARGYSVTGIDLSPAMIAQAREKAAAGARPVVFYRGDIRNVRLDDERYDAAIMMFAVLGYQQADDEVRAALSTARAHLVPGGVFVFDVWYGPGVLREGPSPRHRVVETRTGRIVRHADSLLDETRHLCTVRYKLERWVGDTLAESVCERHVMRFFFPHELEEMARDCGFVCSAIRCRPDWHVSADDSTWTAVGVFRAV